MKRRSVLVSILSIIISFFIISETDLKANVESKQQSISGNLTVITGGQDVGSYTERFNMIYPDVNVNIVTLADYENEIKDMIDAGEYGDVLLAPSSVSYDDWDKYFEPLGDYDKLSEQYYFMNAREKAGKVYGFPMSANGQGLLYNKKVFDEAGIKEIPKTIDEFINCLKLIDENTQAIPFYTNYSEPWAVATWQSYVFGAMTGDADYRYNNFAHEKNPFTEGKNHYIVYKLLNDIVGQGLCEKDILQGNWWQSMVLLNEGKVGCIAQGSWAISSAKSAGAYPDHIGYMPFPNTVNGKQYMTIDADYSYSISKNSKNKEAARAWIDFMIHDSGYARDMGAISIVKGDPLPTWFNEFENVELLIDNPGKDNNGFILGHLGGALELYSGKEQRRIIDSARGESEETFEDIMKEWNDRWEGARPKEAISTEQKHTFSKDFLLDNSNEIFFSELEKEYLAQNKVIKVGYIENLSPLQYKEDKRFLGISADIFEIIKEKTNLNFVYQSFSSFDQMVQALQIGEIDVIAGMEEIDNYKDELSYSKEYIEYINVIVKQKAVDINNLNQTSVGLIEGGLVNYDFNLGKNTIEYYSTIMECLEAVNSKKVDFTFTNYYTVNECLREQNYNNIVIQPLMQEDRYCVAFRKNVDTQLISIINKVIYSISPEQKQVIILKNTQGTYTPPTLKDLVQAYPVTSLLVVIIICCIVIGIVYYLMSLQVSHSKALALNARKYEQLADIAGEYIFEYNYKEDTIIFGEKLKTRLSLNNVQQISNFQSKEVELYKFIEAIKDTSHKEYKQTQLKLALQSEEEEWYRVVYSIIYDEHQKPLFLLGKLVNIHQEVEERILLEEQAEKDQLTGIYNRVGFYKMLDKSRVGKLENGISALCVIDLDEFKYVNDTLGHSGGDEVLVMLACNLQRVFKSDAILSRFGGDEFVVYMENLDTIEELHNKAKELCDSMDTVIQNENNSCKVSISMGIAVDRRDICYEDLLDKADKALYISKENGRNQYKVSEEH